MNAKKILQLMLVFVSAGLLTAVSAGPLEDAADAADTAYTTLDSQMVDIYHSSYAEFLLSSAQTEVTNINNAITAHGDTPSGHARGENFLAQKKEEFELKIIELKHDVAQLKVEETTHGMLGSEKETAMNDANTKATESSTEATARIATLDTTADAAEIAALSVFKDENDDTKALVAIQLAASAVNKKLDAMADSYLTGDPAPSMIALIAATVGADSALTKLGTQSAPEAGTLYKAVASAPAFKTALYTTKEEWMFMTIAEEVKERGPAVLKELLVEHQAPKVDAFGHFVFKADGTFDGETVSMGALETMFRARIAVETAKAAADSAAPTELAEKQTVLKHAVDALRRKIDIADGITGGLAGGGHKLFEMIHKFREWNDTISAVTDVAAASHGWEEIEAKRRAAEAARAAAGFAQFGGFANTVDHAALAVQEEELRLLEKQEKAAIVEVDKGAMGDGTQEAIVKQKTAFTDVAKKTATELMSGCETVGSDTSAKIVDRTAANIDEQIAADHGFAAHSVARVGGVAGGFVSDRTTMSEEARMKADEIAAFLDPVARLLGVVHGAKLWLEETRKMYEALNRKKIVADMSGDAPTGAATRLDPAELETQWTAIRNKLDAGRTAVLAIAAPASHPAFSSARKALNRSLAQLDESTFTGALDALTIINTRAPSLVKKIKNLEKIFDPTKPQITARQSALGATTEDTLSFAESVLGELFARVVFKMEGARDELRQGDVIYAQKSNRELDDILWGGALNFVAGDNLGGISYADDGGTKKARIEMGIRHMADRVARGGFKYETGAELTMSVKGSATGVGERMRQLAPEGDHEKLDTRVILHCDKSAKVDLGNGNLDQNSTKALNILGDKALTLSPVGNGVFSLRSDIWIESDRSLLPTSEFGKKKADPSAPNDGTKATKQEHRLTFTSHIPREIRVLSGATLDLTAFAAYGKDPANPSSTDEWYDDYCKQIVFDGEVTVVIEPGAKIRGPYLPAGKEGKGPVLYFNGNSRLIFEGTENRDEVRWRKAYGDYELGCSDDVCSKILGVVHMWFNKQAEMHINNMALVRVESDHVSPRTDCRFSFQRNAKGFIGTNDTAGGALQIGNVRKGGTGKDPGKLPIKIDAPIPGGSLVKMKYDTSGALVEDTAGGGPSEGQLVEERDSTGARVNLTRFEGGDYNVVNEEGVYRPRKQDDGTYRDADGTATDAGGFIPNNTGARVIDASITVNGDGAEFHIGREGCLTVGAGLVNKFGKPHGDKPAATTDPDTDPTGEQFGCWTCCSGHDTRNFDLSVKKGTFYGGQAGNGNDKEASAIILGDGVKEIGIEVDPDKGKIVGGTNVAIIGSDVGHDKDSSSPPVPVTFDDTARDLTGATAETGADTYSKDADTMAHSILAPGEIIADLGAVGRGTSERTGNTIKKKGPAKEMFITMTPGDISKFQGERTVSSVVKGSEVVVSYVNKNQINRKSIYEVSNNEGVPVDRKSAASAGAVRGTGEDANGNPVKWMDKR